MKATRESLVLKADKPSQLCTVPWRMWCTLHVRQRDNARCQGMKYMVQGDAEDLPFATDSFDRYVSAGSIGKHAALHAVILVCQGWLIVPHDTW
jgi:hypothetical protein